MNNKEKFEYVGGVRDGYKHVVTSILDISYIQLSYTPDVYYEISTTASDQTSIYCGGLTKTIYSQQELPFIWYQIEDSYSDTLGVHCDGFTKVSFIKQDMPIIYVELDYTKKTDSVSVVAAALATKYTIVLNELPEVIL